MAKIAFIVLSPTNQFRITIAKGESLSDILTHATLQNREFFLLRKSVVPLFRERIETGGPVTLNATEAFQQVF